MKSGIRNNNTLKLISATCVTLFSLVSVFAASIAWFSMNKEVNTNNQEVNIETVSGRLSNVYFHAFNDDDDEDGNFNFEKTPFASYEYDWANGVCSVTKSGTDADWNLEDYSALDHDHPVLILFELDHDYYSTRDGEIYIKGNTTVNGFLGARQSNGNPVYDLANPVVHDEDHPTALVMKQDANYDYYAFSSVAAFRNRAFSDDEYTAFLSQNTGDILSFETSEFEESRAFANVNNAAETYEFDQNPSLYESTADSTVKYIALIVEYSSDAIGFIYSTYLGDPTLESWENILHFTCDWSLEIC